ncbi:MAG: NigD-like N-terminal domain-containing protein [Prevotella sp.]|jgi:hypothetical protein|nr:NigD-like N-terminal domain-containing protein [Prevotella sp.]
MKHRLILSALGAVLLLFSCSQDSYDKGEGTYSLMRADFVEVHTNADKLIDQAVTDDNVLLTLQPPLATSWVKTPDSVYRAVLYYNKVEGQNVEAVQCSRVSVAPITPKDSLKNGMKTDPLRLESMWVAKTLRYLNVGFYLKSGQTDDKNALHHLGIVTDTLIAHTDGKRTLYLQLYHDQGGVPDYYFQRSYISIPLYNLKADSISLSVHTYDGVTSRLFAIK